MSNIDLAMISKSDKQICKKKANDIKHIHLPKQFLPYFNILIFEPFLPLTICSIKPFAQVLDWKIEKLKAAVFLLKSLFQTIYVFCIITSNDKTESPSDTEIFQHAILNNLYNSNTLEWF